MRRLTVLCFLQVLPVFPRQGVNKNLESVFQNDAIEKPSPVNGFGVSNKWAVYSTISLYALKASLSTPTRISCETRESYH